MAREERAGRSGATVVARAQAAQGRARGAGGVARPVLEGAASPEAVASRRVLIGLACAGVLVLLIVVRTLLAGDPAPVARTDASPSAPAGDGVAAPAAPGRPTLVRLELDPASPTRDDTLTAVTEVADPEGDPVYFEYRWVVNEADTEHTGPTLSLAGLEPGTRVAVRVVPFDAGGPGAGLVSRAVVVTNRAPEITRLDIQPDPPQPGQPVSLDIEATDPDGDAVSFFVQWTVDDQPVYDVTGTTLEAGRVKSGARVHATVTPQDPFGSGADRATGIVLVGNRPPEIRSAPPSPAPGAPIRHQVVASDPDGDRVTYVLQQGPPGMTIDAASGVLEWRPVPVPGDSVPVVVRVEDGKGGVSEQRFSVRAPRPS